MKQWITVAIRQTAPFLSISLVSVNGYFFLFRVRRFPKSLYCAVIMYCIVWRVNYVFSRDHYNIKFLFFSSTFSDVEEPWFTFCPSNITRETIPRQSTAVAQWETPEAFDNSGSVASLSCNSESGATFQMGDTTVMCVAIDRSGNKANCSFYVEVIGKYTIWLT